LNIKKNPKLQTIKFNSIKIRINYNIFYTLCIYSRYCKTLFFIIALKLLGGVKTILLYSATSIFGMIFLSIILSEEITIIDIVSVTIVISGIYLMRNKLGSE